MTGSLRGRTLFVTGASRGIGKAIALAAARDGASVAIAAKTVEPHPRLPGTIFTAAQEVEAAGGRALPLQVDVRDEGQIAAAVSRTVETFGKIDALVVNASAIFLGGTVETPMKRWDLMNQVNVRATFACAQACIPALARAERPHILVLAPPPRLEPRWLAPHLAYSLSKLGMSLCVMGLAEELRGQGIGVNGLWPRTAIATAALGLLGGPELERRARRPEIVADAAHAVLCRDPRSCTGRFFIDEEVLREEGVTDFERYAVEPGAELLGDLFVG